MKACNMSSSSSSLQCCCCLTRVNWGFGLFVYTRGV